MLMLDFGLLIFTFVKTAVASPVSISLDVRHICSPENMPDEFLADIVIVIRFVAPTGNSNTLLFNLM